MRCSCTVFAKQQHYCQPLAAEVLYLRRFPCSAPVYFLSQWVELLESDEVILAAALDPGLQKMYLERHSLAEHLCIAVHVRVVKCLATSSCVDPPNRGRGAAF